MRTLFMLLIIGAGAMLCGPARAQSEDAAPVVTEEQIPPHLQQKYYPQPDFELRKRQITCQKWKWGWVTLGAGGAAFLGAAVTGMITSAKAADLEDRCPDKHCLDERDRDLKESVDAFALTTDLLLSVGGVLAVTGAVFLIGSWREYKSYESRAITVAPVIATGSGGVVLDWRF